MTVSTARVCNFISTRRLYIPASSENPGVRRQPGALSHVLGLRTGFMAIHHVESTQVREV